MATKQQVKPNKRKQISVTNNDVVSKKPKLGHQKPSNSQFKASENRKEKKVPVTKRERRLHAKGLAEARKKKRKRHYTLEQELASLWEKMRVRNIEREGRSKLVTEALEKMRGKIPEIASSHVSSRVLQTCVKHCSEDERNAVFEELKPHFLTLACNTYAVHLVKKMLDNASKKQLALFISSLHGHVASLLRHVVGSVVIEHAYHLGNATQRQELLLELYSVELQLFKDLVSMKESRLTDVISKLQIKKSSVLRHMTSVIQPILEKGIVDHSIIHRFLMEYLSIADKTTVSEVIQQLSSSLLVRMIHTRDGARIGILCVKHGSTKERKKIIKGMKGNIMKIAQEQYASMVLVCIISVVDDTKLISRVVIKELEKNLKELVLDKNGRRILLQLLHPNCSRYFSPDDLLSLNSSIPSLSNKCESAVCSDVKNSGEDNSDEEGTEAEADKSKTPVQSSETVEGGKKDPSIRRQELLIDSRLAENLVDVCIENAGEFLRSNFGREVLYEVAIGGADGILRPKFNEKLDSLYEAIASLAMESKSEEKEEEHILENFHSSRTIRKLILDCPSFALTLWNKALKGRTETWAQGHSCKVIRAYLDSTDSAVREVAKAELQPLSDEGML